MASSSKSEQQSTGWTKLRGGVEESVVDEIKAITELEDLISSFVEGARELTLDEVRWTVKKLEEFMEFHKKDPKGVLENESRLQELGTKMNSLKDQVATWNLLDKFEMTGYGGFKYNMLDEFGHYIKDRRNETVPPGIYIRFKDLYDATLEGNWEKAKKFLEKHPYGLISIITDMNVGILHVSAAAAGHPDFFRNLLIQFKPEDLEFADWKGNNVLHLAVENLKFEVAKSVVKMNPKLTDIARSDGSIPILVAATLEHPFSDKQENEAKQLIKYLLDETTNPFRPNNAGMDLLAQLARIGFHDIIAHVLKKHKDRIRLILSNNNYREVGTNFLSILASCRPKDFKSSTRLKFWENWMYKLAPDQLPCSNKDDKESPSQDIKPPEGQSQKVDEQPLQSSPCSNKADVETPSQDKKPPEQKSQNVDEKPHQSSGVRQWLQKPIRMLDQLVAQRKSEEPLRSLSFSNKADVEAPSQDKKPPEQKSQYVDEQPHQSSAVRQWLQKLASKLLPIRALHASIQRIKKMKCRHGDAKRLVDYIFEEAKHVGVAHAIFQHHYKFLNLAAENGIVEIIGPWVKTFPHLMALIPPNCMTPLHVAVYHRQDKIYNTIVDALGIYVKKVANRTIHWSTGDESMPLEDQSTSKTCVQPLEDQSTRLPRPLEGESSSNTHVAQPLEDQNNSNKHVAQPLEDQNSSNKGVKYSLLHMAALLPPSRRLKSIAGTALQMQWELQWFQEVEPLVDPIVLKTIQNGNKTVREIFTEQHKDLVEKAEDWLKDTSNSCMVVTALIATVVFAAAFTVPGGNNDQGLPNFIGKMKFIAFIVSDSIALFCSLTSLLMFLSILTSRYAEEDFSWKLPMKLLTGMFFLLIAMATTMISFVASVWIILGEEHLWLQVLVTVGAAIPVIGFWLFVNTGFSTFGHRIFYSSDAHASQRPLPMF